MRVKKIIVFSIMLCFLFFFCFVIAEYFQPEKLPVGQVIDSGFMSLIQYTRLRQDVGDKEIIVLVLRKSCPYCNEIKRELWEYITTREDLCWVLLGDFDLAREYMQPYEKGPSCYYFFQIDKKSLRPLCGLYSVPSAIGLDSAGLVKWKLRNHNDIVKLRELIADTP